MENKLKVMTVSEFAKFHNINTRTLHYYDKIGLFSPMYIGENNYRYYSLQQSIELEFILMFRELGFSISNIKMYLEDCNPKNFLKIAEDRLDFINKEINKLNKLKSILENKKEILELSTKVLNNSIEILEYKENYIVEVPFVFKEYNIEHILDKSKKIWQLEKFKVNCGSYISLDKIINDDFSEYNGLFFPISNKFIDTDLEQFVVCLKGKYLCSYSIGDFSNLKTLYKKILKFASENSLNLIGNAYEIGLNEFAISKIDDYVTKIIIKIEE